MPTILPPALRPGDTIAIIPTARAIGTDELRDGIALAEGWRLRVKLGAGIGRKDYQQAGTAEERAADLQAALNDPEVRAIWCARGGYGTVHLLEHLDLSVLKKDPKWIVGFSDITVLHNALHHVGVASLHAQMPFAIGNKSEECVESIREILFSKDWPVVSGQSLVVSGRSLVGSVGLDTRHCHSEPSLRGSAKESEGKLVNSRSGSCEGVLVGGNLSVLYSLRGTPFDLNPSGKILFLEDLDELRYHMDRMIQNLNHGSWFKELAGLVVGGMSDMRDRLPEDPFGKEVEEMIAEAVDPYNYPVCYGFPAGHITDNRALVLGAKAKLSVTEMGAVLEMGV